MMSFWLDLLLMPAAGSIAGIVIWALSRRHPFNDHELLAGFSSLLLVFTLIGWGTSQSHFARRHIDPRVRIQDELDAHPLYATIKRLAPNDYKQLHDVLMHRLLIEGQTMEEAFRQTRPLLTQQGNYRLGWADRSSTLAWAQVTVDSFKALQSYDPAECYRATKGQPLAPQTLSAAFSTEANQMFQQALIDVYVSADQGLRNELPPETPRIELTEIQKEYRLIREELAQQFGDQVARQLLRSDPMQLPITEAPIVCAANIAQLEAFLERPPAIAVRLARGTLYTNAPRSEALHGNKPLQ